MDPSNIEAQIRFQHLEGARVSLTLADGSHLDDVELVSCGHGNVESLWLDRQGVDVFVRKGEVVRLREVALPAA